jgi:hypothetical protein
MRIGHDLSSEKNEKRNTEKRLVGGVEVGVGYGYDAFPALIGRARSS